MISNQGKSWLIGIGAVSLAAFAGMVTALIPALGIGLTLLSMLIGVLLLACAQRDTGELSQAWRQRFIIAFVVVNIFWPTYIALHIEPLPRVDPRRLVALLSLCIFIYLMVSRAAIREKLTQLPFAARLALTFFPFLLLIRAWSVLISPTLGTAVPSLFWELTGYFVPFLLALLVLDGVAAQRILIRIVLFTALVCSAIAVVEFAVGSNVISSLLMRFSDDSELMTAMSSSRVRDGALRAQGPFEHPLLLAEFGSIGFCFAIAALLWPRGVTKPGLAWFGLLASLLCIVLSFSRSALVCASVGALWLGLLWLWQPRAGHVAKSPGLRLATIAAIVLSVGASAIYVGRDLAAGKTQAESESSMARAVMLQRGLSALEVQPLQGFGIGSAGPIAGIKGRAGVITLDNYFLIIALESGLPYFALFLGFFLTAIGAASYHVLAGGPNSSALAGIAAALLALMTMRSVLGINYILPIAFLMAGLAYSALAAHSPRQTGERG